MGVTEGDEDYEDGIRLATVVESRFENKEWRGMCSLDRGFNL